MTMLEFLQLLLLVAGVESAMVKHRLIGGEPCGKNERRHQVWVFPPKGFCGGTLIDKQWVLTAAHCYNEWMPGTVSVWAGVHPYREFKKFVINSSGIHVYDKTLATGDIMLIKLPAAVRGITPAQLPDYSCETPAIGEKLQVAGHGSTVRQNDPYDRNKPLQCLDLQVSPCFMQKMNYFCGDALYGNSDAYICPGDSGGGWLKKQKILGKHADVIYGVVHGYFSNNNKNTLFTSVCAPTIRKWITVIMNKY